MYVKLQLSGNHKKCFLLRVHKEPFISVSFCIEFFCIYIYFSQIGTEIRKKEWLLSWYYSLEVGFHYFPFFHYFQQKIKSKKEPFSTLILMFTAILKKQTAYNCFTYCFSHSPVNSHHTSQHISTNIHIKLLAEMNVPFYNYYIKRENRVLRWKD